MTDMAGGIRQEVWKRFAGSQVVFLGTAEGEQPRVRPVTLINFDQKFWIATGTRSAKARQIRRNPNVEFCLQLQEGDKTGYVRVAGVAQVVHDRETKEELAEQMDFFAAHWKGVGDPDYTLLRISRVEVEYMPPGGTEAHTFIV